MRKVYVIGVDTLKFGKHLDKSVKDLAQITTTGCLRDAGLGVGDIQALWFSNSAWGNFHGQDCIRGQVALRPLGIEGIPITNVENACASGATAFHHAWLGVASGLYDLTMAVGAEKLYHRNKSATFAAFLGGIDIENALSNVESTASFQMNEKDKADAAAFRARYVEPVKAAGKRKKPPVKDRVMELRDMLVTGINLGEKLGYGTVYELQKMATGDHSPFMDIYGYAARQHMQNHGTTIEQLAAVASKSHFNGSLNPNAQYQFEVSQDKVLRDRLVSWPLTRAMCAPIGDGAASAILCSEAVVKRLGLMKQAVLVRASILGSGTDAKPGVAHVEIGERLARKAYEVAGVGPDDINMAEVHDATSFGEICQVENLGFCPRGEGGRLAESGATSLTGRIPINTSGGLTSRGHPIGASGLAQLHELVVQLRGTAGKRQVANARLGMAENGGGALGNEEAAMGMHILEAPSLK